MRVTAFVLLAVLAGCGARAAGPSASVDVNALVKAHPLYSTLAQYDRQIAQLRATLDVPEFSRKEAAFANAQRAVRTQLDATAARSRRIAAIPEPNVQSLVSIHNDDAPTEGRVRSDMQHAYQAQAAQLRATAEQDMNRYRVALLAQQGKAYADYVRAVHARAQQAYASRKQELYERESTLSLDLAKGDVNERLLLRAKLQTLALSGSARHALQAQLDAIRAHDNALVAEQRARDRARLAAFLPPLQTRANADIVRMRAELQARTAANLAGRQRVLAAQTAKAVHLNFGAPAQANAASTDMRSRLNALLHARPADPNVFIAARESLIKDFARVRSADDAATRSTKAQIAALEKDRAQLYSTIQSQIMRDARSVADARGLRTVYAANQAPPGSTDITAAVRSDFAALSH